MRVSSISWAFDDLESVLREASRSAKVTHNQTEGIKGAQAVAACVFWHVKATLKTSLLDSLHSDLVTIPQ